MSQIDQRQTQKLLQKLSPQQIQMIKLLELPTMQLEQRIQREIEENPVLEEENNDDKDEQPKEVSMEEYFAEDDTPHYKYHINNFSKDDEKRPVYLSEGQSFTDYLNEQLSFKQLSPKDNTIAQFLIGSLDDSGYLRRDLTAIADDIAFSLGIEVSEQEMEKILKLIQQLEPAGIGARSLNECLILQLKALPKLNKAQKLALDILSNHFDEFIKKHYEKLIKKLGVSEDDFKEAIEEIIKLSPKPSNLYSDGNRDNLPYITPDFILDYQNGIFDLKLNSSNIPNLKVSKRYVDMIREIASSNGTGKDMSNDNKEALQFVKSKIDSAKWFISAIKQRQDTLMRTMQAILNYQQEYFVDGDQLKLRPMILKDIADITSLDVSTISRVVNSKYVQTQFGIIPLKQLFSEAMQTDSGEEVSSYEIKNILSKCISEEDKRKPLTDEVLMDILNSKGYHIARRTVAKYREMLGIPVARLRKQLQ